MDKKFNSAKQLSMEKRKRHFGGEQCALIKFRMQVNMTPTDNS